MPLQQPLRPASKPVSRPAAPAHQRGAALVTALIIVAAATVAVAGMMWRQSIALRKAENRADVSQARWLARGAVDWARVVLLADARTTNIDHLGELWATPLAETRLTADDAMFGSGGLANSADHVAVSADADGIASISGQIHDAEAHYNLTNMVRRGSAGDEINPDEGAVLVRLVRVLGLPETLARSIAASMIAAQRPTRLEQLSSVIGAQAVAQLSPFVTILPQPTPVNLNTAPAEVLSARFTNLPLDSARALVESRTRAYFVQVSDAFTRLPGVELNATPSQVAVATRYFEIEGRIRERRVDLVVQALVERESSGATHIIQLREL